MLRPARLVPLLFALVATVAHAGPENAIKANWLAGDAAMLEGDYPEALERYDRAWKIAVRRKFGSFRDSMEISACQAAAMQQPDPRQVVELLFRCGVVKWRPAEALGPSRAELILRRASLEDLVSWLPAEAEQRVMLHARMRDLVGEQHADGLAALFAAHLEGMDEIAGRLLCEKVEAKGGLDAESAACTQRFPPLPPLQALAVSLHPTRLAPIWTKSARKRATDAIETLHERADDAALAELQAVVRPVVEWLFEADRVDEGQSLAVAARLWQLDSLGDLLALGDGLDHRRASSEDVRSLERTLVSCGVDHEAFVRACVAFAEPLIRAWEEDGRLDDAARIARAVGPALRPTAERLASGTLAPLVESYHELTELPAAALAFWHLARASGAELDKPEVHVPAVPSARVRLAGPLPSSCKRLEEAGFDMARSTGAGSSPLVLDVWLTDCSFSVGKECDRGTYKVGGYTRERTVTDWTGTTSKFLEKVPEEVVGWETCGDQNYIFATIDVRLEGHDAEGGGFTEAGRLVGARERLRYGGRIESEYTMAASLGLQHLKEGLAEKAQDLRAGRWIAHIRASAAASRAGQRELALDHAARAWLLGERGYQIVDVLVKHWGVERSLAERTFRQQ